MARQAAATARREQAAAAVVSTVLLQGEPSFLSFPPVLSTPSFVASVASRVVSPLFQTMPAPYSAPSPVISSAPVSVFPSIPAATVAPNLAVTCADSFFCPLVSGNSTVTSIPTTPLRSVYLLQGSISSSVQTPGPNYSNVTPVRDEVQTPTSADPPVTTVTTDVLATAAAATLFHTSPPQTSTTFIQIPDSTSVQPTIMIPPPNYTPFEGLFPLNFYPSLASMPTSQMVHTLVHTLAWTSTLLRGYASQHPLPSFLGPMDELGRSFIRNTPMWPGSDHTLSSSLEELLAAMLPRYAELIARHSVNY